MDIEGVGEELVVLLHGGGLIRDIGATSTTLRREDLLGIGRTFALDQKTGEAKRADSCLPRSMGPGNGRSRAFSSRSASATSAWSRPRRWWSASRRWTPFWRPPSEELARCRASVSWWRRRCGSISTTRHNRETIEQAAGAGIRFVEESHPAARGP